MKQLHAPIPLAVLVFLMAGITLFGQPRGPRIGSVQTSLQAAVDFEQAADLDGGGEVEILRYDIGLTLGYILSDSGSLALGLDYRITDYDFSDIGGNPVSDPWGTLQEIDLSLYYRHRLDSDGALLLGAGIASSRESGGDFGDSLVFSGIVGYSHPVSDNLRIGFAIGGQFGLEDDDFIGYPVLIWRLDENWTFATTNLNALGGPGVFELAYTGLPGWEFGLGAGYRASRFLLDDSGANPDGYVEASGIPAAFRVAFLPGESTRLELLAGSLFNGEFEIDAADGNRLLKEDHDPPLILSLNVSHQF